MTKLKTDEKLRQDIRNLMCDLEQISLPYLVTDKLQKLMDKHNIEREPHPRGASVG